jgi:hypothetical protein
MTKIGIAALITGLVLLGFVRAVQTFGAPLVIVVLVAGLAILIKVRNVHAEGHQASGIDKINQPGRAVTVGDRTSRWWDTERELEHRRHSWLLSRILPYREVRVGSLDTARRQQAKQQAGKPVRPIDWTAPNRNGGGSFAGGMTASGMTYDWCTCSEQAMPLLSMPDGSQRANRGEETCLCQCSECRPKGRYYDQAEAKMMPIKPRHWREREMEHEVAVSLADNRRRAEVGRVTRLCRLARDFRNDRAADKRDEQAAAAAGWEHPNVRRARGEEVITDTDEWYYRHGFPGDDGDDDTDDDRPTDPINAQPGGHE